MATINIFGVPAIIEHEQKITQTTNSSGMVVTTSTKTGVVWVHHNVSYIVLNMTVPRENPKVFLSFFTGGHMSFDMDSVLEISVDLEEKEKVFSYTKRTEIHEI